MARVNIPANADDLIKLMEDIIEKETGLGPNATLTADELAELIGYKEIADESNKKQKKFRRDAEDETGKRNLALGTAEGQRVDLPGSGMYLITYVRDIQLAKNKSNPKALGAWGFDVDDSPQAPPAQPE